jgi:CRISPR/Cas system-associated exonuclease Cas4 (RecB family)|tara:strand:- start:4325 stop:5077 length:753 start_codon:yes stop_codon:yes gene_type:complete
LSLKNEVPKVQDIYDSYIESLQSDKFATRYSGKENWYHSSVAGMCIRKHYFASVLKVEQSDKKNPKTLRLFRLGDIVHHDIQTAVQQYALAKGLPLFIEKELFIDDLNVRGFIDLGFVDKHILYDIKTTNAYRWKLMFGRDGDFMEVSKNYQLQLGTYGLWYKREYGDLKGLKLVFYNKDTSIMKEVDLELDVLDKAEEYWLKVKDLISKGQPPIAMHSSPYYRWECNPSYCSYYTVCGGGVERKHLKNV